MELESANPEFPPGPVSGCVEREMCWSRQTRNFLLFLCWWCPGGMYWNPQILNFLLFLCWWCRAGRNWSPQTLSSRLVRCWLCRGGKNWNPQILNSRPAPYWSCPEGKYSSPQTPTRYYPPRRQNEHTREKPWAQTNGIISTDYLRIMTGLLCPKS